MTVIRSQQIIAHSEIDYKRFKRRPSTPNVTIDAHRQRLHPPPCCRCRTLGALLVVGLLWHLLTAGWGVISPARFPPPLEVGAAFQQILTEGYSNGRLHEHVARSVLLVTMGFALASTVGVLLGLAMGASRTVEAIANPVFLLLRPIPPLAWIPLAIVWLGLGDAAKMMVIFFAAFVPSVINSYTGVRQIDKPLFEAAAMLGVNGPRHWREVLVPGALPSIFTGLRLSLQASLDHARGGRADRCAVRAGAAS